VVFGFIIRRVCEYGQAGHQEQDLLGDMFLSDMFLDSEPLLIIIDSCKSEGINHEHDWELPNDFRRGY